jgi:hypothetical protein
MSSENAARDIIELLAAHEEAIGELYSMFAARFPSHREFWNVLSAEEQLHASWIRHLYKALGRGDVRLSPDRFEPDFIKQSLGYIAGETERFKNQDLSLKDALSAGVKIETTPVESRFFEVYDSDDDTLKDLLRALKEAFIDHRNRLQNMLAQQA